MHMTINAIVYSTDLEAAQAKATEIFERLTENQHPFDYFTIYDKPIDAESPKGQETINDFFQYQKRDFLRYADALRYFLDHASNEYLFENQDEWNQDHTCFHYACGQIGQYRGSSVWIYDNDGEGIRTPSHLKDALTKWATLYEEQGKTNPHADDSIWLVQADVHF